MGLLVINAPYLAGTALVLLPRGLVRARRHRLRRRRVAIDGTARASRWRRSRASATWRVAVLLLVTRHVSVTWLVAVAARAAHVRHRLDDGGHAGPHGPTTRPDGPRRPGSRRSSGSRRPVERSRRRGEARAPRPTADGSIAFIVTLFAIHVARMQPDGTLLGYVAPAIAVLGDMVLAVLFALVVVAPIVVSLRDRRRAGSSGACGAGTSRPARRTRWRHRIARGGCGYRLAHGDAVCAKRATRCRRRSGGAWPPACPPPPSSRPRCRCGA